MKRILIVGAGGFIGKNLKEYLQDHYDVYSPGHEELDALSEEAVVDYLKQNQFDTVVHAAIYNPRVGTGKDATKEIENDLRLYMNFAKHEDLYGRMFYFGSGAEFNKAYPVVNAGEDTDRGIHENAYAFAKYMINQDIRHRKLVYNLRIFGLFGPYENWVKTFISGACCKAMYDLPITIRQNVYFDYLYIRDFCRIMERLIETPMLHYHDYNVVSGKRIDLCTIADLVKKVSKKDVPVIVCREGMGNEYTASNARLREELGDISYTDMEESIRNLYAWYCEHRDEIELEKLLY